MPHVKTYPFPVGVSRRTDDLRSSNLPDMAPEKCTASENDEPPLELPSWAGLTTAFLAYRIQHMDPTAVRVGVATAHNSHEPYIDCRQDDESTTFNVFVNGAHIQLELPGQHAKKSTIKFATKAPDDDDDEWEVTNLAFSTQGSKKTRKKNDQARRRKKELRQKVVGDDVPGAPLAAQGAAEGPDIYAVKDKSLEDEPVKDKSLDDGSVENESANDKPVEDTSVQDEAVEPRRVQGGLAAPVADDHDHRATDPSTSDAVPIGLENAARSTDVPSTAAPGQGASPPGPVPDAEHSATPAPPAATGSDDTRSRYGTIHILDPHPEEESLSWADMVVEEERDHARWEKARAAGKDLPKGAETPWWRKPLRFSSGAVVAVPEPPGSKPTESKPHTGRAVRSRRR